MRFSINWTNPFTRGPLTVPVLLLYSLFLSACHSLSLHKQEPVIFEVREVRCTEEVKSLSWDYNCEGTLLTRDIRLREKQVLVWTVDMSKRPNGERFYPNIRPSYFLMSNGVATLSTLAVFDKRVTIGGLTSGQYETDPGQPQPEWKIVGYTPLEEAHTEVEK